MIMIFNENEIFEIVRRHVQDKLGFKVSDLELDWSDEVIKVEIDGVDRDPE